MRRIIFAAGALGLAVTLGLVVTGPARGVTDALQRTYLPLVVAGEEPAPVPGSTPTATPTQIPASQISVLRAWSCTDGSYTYVYGEVANGPARNAFSVRVDVVFYNSDDSIAGTNYTYADESDLRPGQRSTFEVIAQPQPGWSRYEVTASDSFYDWLTMRTTPYLPISGLNSWTDGSAYHVAGQVTNNTGSPVQYAEVLGVFSDGAGHPVSAGYTFTNLSTLAPGQSGAFQFSISLSGCQAGAAQYEVYAMGQAQ